MARSEVRFDQIKASSARIFWSEHRQSHRVVDVWVSTTGQDVEAFTTQYFSPRWDCVVGDCDSEWLSVPVFTPEAVFGELVSMGFHSTAELVHALRQFAKIDSCHWALPMLARLEVSP